MNTKTNLDTDCRKVLNKLYFAKSLSVATLSRELGVSIPTCMKTVSDLLRSGYITEVGLAPSTGGRRPVMYSIEPQRLFLVSVAMDQFVTRFAIQDISDHALTNIQSCEFRLRNDSTCLREITRLLKTFVKESGIDITRLIGVGIGMPGFIDVVKGINYSYLHIEGSSIVSYISHEIGLPVFIDNDSSLIALAEFRFGAARNTKNSMVLNMSWGIGLGMVLDEKIFRGHNGFAGEFSHIPIFMNGKLCSCGKRGCLETESSLKYVVEKAREAQAYAGSRLKAAFGS